MDKAKLMVLACLLLCAGCSAPESSSGAISSGLAVSPSNAGTLVPLFPALAVWTPTAANPDPSLKIPDIVTGTYNAGVHVLPTQRVAYDHWPPIGGPHDGYWATCAGTVYAVAVRNENMVHSLEHGAVWIAYKPDQVTGADLSTLQANVQGKPYSMISPYPGLDRPISLQAWGHQLKVDNAHDPRIDEFITALRANTTTTPEVGASCNALGSGLFDPKNPPPFDPTPPGPHAKPMNYADTAGAQPDQTTSDPATRPAPTR